MRKIYLFFLLVCAGVSTNAQDSKPELNCYNKWAFKFEERGAEEVEDGTYTDVIITFRSGAFADCYNGKVIVKNKKVGNFYVELDDGTYEQVVRVWKTDLSDVPIVNGISKTMVTKDNALVNVLWIKKIKPKKAAAKKAPEPDLD